MLIQRGKYKKKAVVDLSPEREAKRDEVIEHLSDGTYPQEEVPCFCGNTGGVTVAERDRYGLPVTTLLCMDCGLMRISPRMTKEATALYYENDYRILDTRQNHTADILFQEEYNFSKTVLEKVTKNILKDNALIYEVGTGCGGFLAAYKDAGYRVAGCDLGSEYLDIGRAKGLDLINGTIDDLVAHTGEQADLLVMVHTLEHFLDLSEELSRVINAVKPGGYVFVRVPGIGFISETFSSNVIFYLQNVHTWYFTADTLTYVLETCGLQVLIASEGDTMARRPLPGETIQVRSTVGSDEAERIAKYLETVENTVGYMTQQTKDLIEGKLNTDKVNRDAMYAMGFQAAVGMSAEIQYIIECKTNGFAEKYPELHRENLRGFWELVGNLISQGLDPYWIERLVNTHQRRT